MNEDNRPARSHDLVKCVMPESYLFNRNHFVSFHGVPSEVCSISCGVPQGSILGPLLFVLLINDLEFQLKYSQIILYADDAVIYFADKDISIIQERLNADLECISNWFSDNNLIVCYSELIRKPHGQRIS